MGNKKSLFEKELSGTVVKARVGRRVGGKAFRADDRAPLCFSSAQRATWESLRDEFNALGILGRVNKPALDVLAVAITQLIEDVENPEKQEIDFSTVFAMLERFGLTPNSRENFLPIGDQ